MTHGVLRRSLAGGAAVWLGLRAWAAVRPTAFPYFARRILDLPRPWITPARLVALLAPRPGERILEIGPGTGFFSMPVAERLVPGGKLEILDVRQSFLDHTVARGRRGGLHNIVSTRGDGRSLPYPDGSFDAAYLVSVLGEIADPANALREIRRTLKPGGRLVIGELFIDPDFPRLGWLVKQARAAGFRLERRTGPSFAYFVELRPGTEAPA